jgi:hypothetical protein
MKNMLNVSFRPMDKLHTSQQPGSKTQTLFHNSKSMDSEAYGRSTSLALQHQDSILSGAEVNSGSPHNFKN